MVAASGGERESAQLVAAINAGAHVAPAFAGDTVYVAAVDAQHASSPRTRVHVLRLLLRADAARRGGAAHDRHQRHPRDRRDEGSAMRDLSDELKALRSRLDEAAGYLTR